MSLYGRGRRAKTLPSSSSASSSAGERSGLPTNNQMPPSAWSKTALPSVNQLVEGPERVWRRAGVPAGQPALRGGRQHLRTRWPRGSSEGEAGDVLPARTQHADVMGANVPRPHGGCFGAIRGCKTGLGPMAPSVAREPRIFSDRARGFVSLGYRRARPSGAPPSTHRRTISGNGPRKRMFACVCVCLRVSIPNVRHALGPRSSPVEGPEQA
jgi:hypothetical protein